MHKLMDVDTIPTSDGLRVLPKAIQKINEKNDKTNQSKNK
jgi:hypothetical protein